MRTVAWHDICLLTVPARAKPVTVPTDTIALRAEYNCPAGPCCQLAACLPVQIRLALSLDAHHNFDLPNMPVATRTGLAYTAKNNGTAYAGTNPDGQADALQQVPAFIAQLPPAAPAPR